MFVFTTAEKDMEEEARGGEEEERGEDSDSVLVVGEVLTAQVMPDCTPPSSTSQTLVERLRLFNQGRQENRYILGHSMIL